MKIVGVDLSLTSTGLAAILTDGGATASAYTSRITTKGARADTLTDRLYRLTQITHRVADWTRYADLVVIEGPSYGQGRANAGQHDRSGLWWLVVRSIPDVERRVAVVAPAARAKYATGRGNAPKDDVLTAVVRRYADVDVNGNDEADALVLAAMGARHLGHPIEQALPATHLTAMDAVPWPTVGWVAA